jgi:hypothetical protein
MTGVNEVQWHWASAATPNTMIKILDPKRTLLDG